MDVPARADAAKARERKRRPRKALRDIARRIDPQHEEGNPARPATAERGQPVAGLFEADSDTAAHHLDIIADFFTPRVDSLTGHQQRGGRRIMTHTGTPPGVKTRMGP